MQSLIIFAAAFILSILLTPIAKIVAFKFNLLDQPGERKIHSTPIPLIGGVAVCLAFCIALLFSGLALKEMLGIIVIGVVFVVFGLLDDAGIKVRARYKIWSHLVFSFILILTTGISLDLFKVNIINIVLSAGFITFMTNSMNMLDGMDGLVSGVGMIASIFFFILALNSGQTELSLLTLALSGACFGFLRYNFNPASIFLGESGSTFIGFVLAVISLKLNIFKLWDIALLLNIPRVQIVSFIIPLIILAIPIFDTCFVFFNRYSHHIKMSTAGKDHSHHRIHLMGLSQKMTVLTLYAVQIILGSIALSMIGADFQQFASLIIILGIMAFFAWGILYRVEVYSKPS
jgi:UDP-GlcNAc:undecaprenyl-phosphate/decaprenyl-phosphate GlcNAc-1-phosphate transferase